MLKWYDNLYIGDKSKRMVDYYMYRINHGKPVKDIYLITLASNEANQLDIIKSNYLLQPVVMRMCPMVVGIAKGYDEARDLVVRMIEEALDKTGRPDVRKYLLQR